VVLGRLVVGGADAEIGIRDGFLDGPLLRRVEEVAFQETNVEIGPAVFEPAFGESGFRFANGAERERMALDVVRLVNVRLDQRNARDARVAAEHVQDGHAAAAGSDLEEMRHCEPHRTVLRTAAKHDRFDSTCRFVATAFMRSHRAATA